MSLEPIRISIQTLDFDAGSELEQMRHQDSRIGALCCLIGTVRDRACGQEQAQVHALELEHYPGMTERAIEDMAEQAVKRFELINVRVIHRVGPLALQDQIVLVATGAMHRFKAFEGCAFLMDYLKTQAPFWKKEFTSQGERWVQARESDDAALARWGIDARNA